MNEVTLRRARLVLGWVTVSGRVYRHESRYVTGQLGQLSLVGLLNRVPASAGVKGWNVTSAGRQVTLCDTIWHVSSSRGVATLVSELPYPCYLLPNSITLAGSELDPNMFGASSELVRS